MSKLLSVAAAGMVACLLLATPNQAQAQHIRFSIGNYNPGYYGGGYSNYGRAYPGNYGYSNYYGGGGYGYGHSHGNYGRPTIVHPEYNHWTPSRGLHTHGHYHVPHRGHYHTYRY